jgi:hypothetical protein
MIVRTLPGAIIAIVQPNFEKPVNSELIFCDEIPEDGKIDIPSGFFKEGRLLRIRCFGWMPFEMDAAFWKRHHSDRAIVLQRDWIIANEGPGQEVKMILDDLLNNLREEQDDSSTSQ